MASPFSIFRKHQKAFLAALALLAMIAFVFLSGPVFDSLTSGTVRNPVVVSTKRYGNLTEADLANLIRQQTMVLTFFERVYRTMGFALPVEPPSEEAVVETWILANRAKELGVVISNQTINAYLQEMTGGKISRETLREILREMHLSDRQLFEALRMRLAAQQMLEMIEFSTTPTTPAQRWDYYQRLNRRATVELVAEPVAKYLDRIAEPDEATLKEFFEKYKENYYDPSLPEPGFRRPHRVVVEYLKADIAQFIEPASITKEQIQEYYEKNKETHYLRSKLPPVEKTLPKQPASGEPEKPTEAKTPSPPAEPSAKPTEPSSAKPPEEKPTPEKQSPSGEEKPSSEPKPKEKLSEGKTPVEKPSAEKPSAEKVPVEKTSAEKTPPESPFSEKPAPEKSQSTGPEPAPADKSSKSSSEKSGGEKPSEEKPAAPPAAKGTSDVWDQEKIRFPLVGFSEESEGRIGGDFALWTTSADSEPPAPKAAASPVAGENGAASSRANEAAGAKAAGEAAPGEKVEKEQSVLSAPSGSGASKGEAPSASSQAGVKGPESKPTPPEKQAPSEASGTAEAAKPAGTPSGKETPSGKTVPAGAETSKYLSLEEVEGEIREVLARGQAQAKIEQMLQKIRDQMNIYQTRLVAVTRGSEPPPPPNLEALAKQYGLQYRKTPLAAEWQFRRDYRDLAQARIAGRESVVQFLYYQGRPTLQAALAQDVDAYYLFWKLEDAKEAIPSWDYSEAERLEKEAEKARQQGKEQEATSLMQQAQRARKDTEQLRQEVLRAWKMDQARSLARNRAAQLADLARKTGKSLQEALAKEPGVTVLESGPFSWRTHGAISPRLFMQAPPPRISDVPHVEAPGEEFMETVFRLQPGESAVAFNQPQTVAYVVRVKSFEPSQEVLWKMFLAEPYTDYSSVAVFDQQKIRSAWMEALKRDIDFRWERTAHSGRER